MGEKQWKLMYGEEIAKKMALFEEGINEIERKNEAFFKVRPGNSDRLRHHYQSVIDKNGFGFTFEEESDLPISIRDECEALIKRVWEN